MSLASEIKAEILREEESRDRKISDILRNKEEETGKIIKIVEGNGGEISWNNGYIFNFKFKGKAVKLINQSERIIVEMSNLNIDTDEAWLIRNKHKIRDLPRYEQNRANRLFEKIGYRHFIINGTVDLTVHELMSRLIREYGGVDDD